MVGKLTREDDFGCMKRIVEHISKLGLVNSFPPPTAVQSYTPVGQDRVFRDLGSSSNSSWQPESYDPNDPRFISASFWANLVPKFSSICKIECRGKFGTGFLFSFDDKIRVMTNRHVVPQKYAKNAELTFSGESKINSPPHKIIESTYLTPVDPQLDLAVFDFEGSAESIKNLTKLFLDEDCITELEDGPAEEGKATIVQHPQSQELRVAFGFVSTVNLKERQVLYWTHTNDGSSGSPVFDDECKVIAVHFGGDKVNKPGALNRGIPIKFVVEWLNTVKNNLA
jgi:S1-C subfamily serine protease